MIHVNSTMYCPNFARQKWIIIHRKGSREKGIIFVGVFFLNLLKIPVIIKTMKFILSLFLSFQAILVLKYIYIFTCKNKNIFLMSVKAKES